MNHLVLKRFLRDFVLSMILILFAACNKKGKPNIDKIVTTTFMKDQNIEKYRLENSNGVVVELLNLGGIITSIKTPDSYGKIADIALGFDNPNHYLEGHPYFGAIVGRFANRIAHGKFTLEGKEYSLAQNNGTNHLHGGFSGFDKVFWEVEPLEKENGIQLSYTSKDGEEGYPGNLSVTVDYILTDDNILKVKYLAQTDKTTVINLTQHSYFNLSGDFSKKILNHELRLNADKFLPVDSTQIPLGNYHSVVNTPFDFSSSKMIGLDFDANNEQLKIGNGYDHCWVINNPNNKIVKAAEVYHTESGRVMDVYTDQPGIQLYTGNFLDSTLPSKTGSTYGPQTGFCLETQHFPNAPNEPSFPTTVLKPGEIFTSETWFQFSAK